MQTSQQKWDLRFLQLAKQIAQWSKDPSTQTGAIIVRPDYTVASIGYNGFPRHMDDDPKLYADRETKLDRIIHCEMNAILNAKEDVGYCTLYTYPFGSCSRCAVHVIQSGIVRVVSPLIPLHLKERWGDNIERSVKMFEEAGVEVVTYDGI